MENRNSRKGNSRRPSSGNSNKGGSFKNSSSSNSYRKSSSDNHFKKSTSSFGNRDSKGTFGKREDKPDFKRQSSDQGDKKPYKKPFGEAPYKKSSYSDSKKPFGNTDNRKPRFSDGKPSFRKEKSENDGSKPYADRKPSFNRSSGTGDQKPFKKPFGAQDKPRTFKKFDGEKKPFAPREGGATSKSFEERKQAGDFVRKATRTFDDKKSDIKSRFKAKSREEGTFNKGAAKNKDRVFKPRESKAPAKRTQEEKVEGIRLNRYIANSGVCSRRDADLLIGSGEITINGNIVTEMGYIVQPTDVVKYAGSLLKREKSVYVLLNKPKDFITTTNDPDDRRTVMDLVAGAAKERLFPVGRLDRNTTGLLLLTNDGELAERLSHPSNKIKKIYQVTLDRSLDENDFEKIQKGVHLEDGLAEVDDIAIITKDRINLGLEIHIGRNRIVRRIFETLGYNVEKLDRVLYAELTKKDLPRGNWRYLTEQEVIKLKQPQKK